jgi:hypothetical protein
VIWIFGAIGILIGLVLGAVGVILVLGFLMRDAKFYSM